MTTEKTINPAGDTGGASTEKTVGTHMTQEDRIWNNCVERFLSLHSHEANLEASLEEWDHYRNTAAKSEQHAATLARLEALWDLLDHVPRPGDPTKKELQTDTYDGTVPVTTYQARQGTVTACTGTVTDRPAAQRRTLAQKLSWAFPLRRQFAFAAGLAAVFVLVVVALTLNMTGMQTIETDIAEHRRIFLEDGSSVLLGARTVLQQKYSDDQRLILLSQGEAYFTVAKDPMRPFVVRTAEALDVRAVGTAFNVRRAADSVIVSVVEGVVEVQPLAPPAIAPGRQTDTNQTGQPAPTALLEMGQQVTYSRTRPVLTPASIDPDQAISWTRDIFSFSGESLENVISSINRYTEREVVIQDEMAKQFLFTGTVQLENIDHWFEALTSVFPVTVKNQGNQVIIRSHQQKTS